jgi:hypothetical protein
VKAQFLNALDERVELQKSKVAFKPELFSYDRNGLRMAIASIEDETNELYDEWVQHKRHLGNCIDQVRHELLDIAGVAMLAYERTFDVPRVAE